MEKHRRFYRFARTYFLDTISSRKPHQIRSLVPRSGIASFRPEKIPSSPLCTRLCIVIDEETQITSELFVFTTSPYRWVDLNRASFPRVWKVCSARELLIQRVLTIGFESRDEKSRTVCFLFDRVRRLRFCDGKRKRKEKKKEKERGKKKRNHRERQQGRYRDRCLIATVATGGVRWGGVRYFDVGRHRCPTPCNLIITFMTRNNDRS